MIKTVLGSASFFAWICGLKDAARYMAVFSGVLSFANVSENVRRPSSASSTLSFAVASRVVMFLSVMAASINERCSKTPNFLNRRECQGCQEKPSRYNKIIHVAGLV